MCQRNPNYVKLDTNFGRFKWRLFLSSFLAQQRNAAQGRLILDVSRWHNDTSQSVGLLWTSDRPLSKTSTRQHTALTTHRHLCLGGIFFVYAFFCLLFYSVYPLCAFIFSFLMELISAHTNIHASSGIRTRKPSRRAATDLLPKPRGHRARRIRTRTPRKLAAADHHLRQLGHWDRQSEDLCTFILLKSARNVL
jgi:hypothetical protein